MKNFLSCALGVFALALGAAPSWADHGCQNGSCCGQAAQSCSSCGDDCCEKPSLFAKWKARCAKSDCCEPACDHCAGHCYKPTMWQWFMSRKGKEPCGCCPTESCADNCCQPRKKLFGGFFKKKECCDACCDGNLISDHVPAVPAPEKKEDARAAEKIPAPLPKAVEEKKEEVK